MRTNGKIKHCHTCYMISLPNLWHSSPINIFPISGWYGSRTSYQIAKSANSAWRYPLSSSFLFPRWSLENISSNSLDEKLDVGSSQLSTLVTTFIGVASVAFMVELVPLTDVVFNMVPLRVLFSIEKLPKLVVGGSSVMGSGSSIGTKRNKNNYTFKFSSQKFKWCRNFHL